MRLLPLILALALLSACTIPTGEVVAEPTIKLGGAFTLSGWAAEWGESELEGIQMAIDEWNARGGVNGKRVELIIEDMQSDNVKSVAAVNKLLSIDEVDAIIGLTWLETFGSSVGLSELYDTIFMSPTCVTTALDGEYPNIFSTWSSSRLHVKYAMEYLHERGDDRLAIVLGQTPYWRDWARWMHVYADELGMEIVTESYYDGGNTDYRTAFTKLRYHQPDATFHGFDTEAAQLAFLQQRHVLYPEGDYYDPGFELGKSDPVWADAFEGKYFVLPNDRLKGSFAGRFEERYGKEPYNAASNAYDATNILLEAIAETDGSTAAMREYLNTREFDTVTFGRIRFDEYGGIDGGEFAMKQMVNNELVDI